MMNAVMRPVSEMGAVHRPLRRTAEVVVKERGPVNYHCAECGTLLIRQASTSLPDMVVICPVCFSLNEAVTQRELVAV